ncbi:MAG TPA: aldehyde dehydrogenase family protein, partial [Vicinamibacterales bacterium]|nr:aldehyde dehydrogenase family protein [Vicinamibacterales bacterium]
MQSNMWINGEWVAARNGMVRKIVNPADQSVLAEVSEASAEDVCSAVAAARRAFDEGPWPGLPGRERGTMLYRVAEAIRARAAAIAELDVRNMGKPIAEAEFDVADAAHCFEYYAGLAGKVHGETLNVPDNALSMVVREPVGVVGQIIPWNYPILMAAWKLAPALAAGCTVVLKPAEQTPLSALLLGEIFQSLDLPPGVVNIVTGGEVAGAALVADPRVDKIAFTGSAEVGKAIVRECAGGMKRMSMELGGKNPNVVFADADFEQAVDGALFGAFANQGEVCSAGSRLLVERSIYDRLVDALQKKVDRVVLGDPMKRDTKMGPLVTPEHMDKVLGYIDAGVKEGARVVTGGKKAGDNGGYFVEPTVFTNTTPTMKIVAE